MSRPGASSPHSRQRQPQVERVDLAHELAVLVPCRRRRTVSALRSVVFWRDDQRRLAEIALRRAPAGPRASNSSSISKLSIGESTASTPPPFLIQWRPRCVAAARIGVELRVVAARLCGLPASWRSRSANARSISSAKRHRIGRGTSPRTSRQPWRRIPARSSSGVSSAGGDLREARPPRASRAKSGSGCPATPSVADSSSRCRRGCAGAGAAARCRGSAGSRLSADRRSISASSSSSLPSKRLGASAVGRPDVRRLLRLGFHMARKLTRRSSTEARRVAGRAVPGPRRRSLRPGRHRRRPRRRRSRAGADRTGPITFAPVPMLTPRSIVGP